MAEGQKATQAAARAENVAGGKRQYVRPVTRRKVVFGDGSTGEWKHYDEGSAVFDTKHERFFIEGRDLRNPSFGPFDIFAVNAAGERVYDKWAQTMEDARNIVIDYASRKYRK